MQRNIVWLLVGSSLAAAVAGIVWLSVDRIEGRATKATADTPQPLLQAASAPQAHSAPAVATVGVRTPVVERITPCTPNTRQASGGAPQQNSSTLIRKISERLLSAPSSLEQATGLYFQAINTSFDRNSCVGNDCSSAWATSRAAAIAATETLASRMRVVVSDGAYPLALTACILNQPTGAAIPACLGLSARHWAEADPDNAWPWLLLAAESRLFADFSGVESAMHRASQSKKWDDFTNAPRKLIAANIPFGTVAEALVAAQPVFDRVGIGLDSGLASVGAYCKDPMDGNKSQVCKKLAEGLLSNVTTRAQLELALSIAQRSGIDDSDLNAARALRTSAEAAALSSMLRPPVSPEDQCRYANAMSTLQVRVLEVGELNALRTTAQ